MDKPKSGKTKRASKKLIRHPSIKGLRAKLWKLVSEYVRRKDVDKDGLTHCYTCGVQAHWHELDCGHYVHKDALDYEINNLRPQCTRCNRYLHGNLGVYAEKLIKEIGEEEIGLMRQRSKEIKKWNVQELEDLIKTYKETLAKMNGGSCTN